MTNKSDDKITPLRPPHPCPECGKDSKREFYPFCSARCRAVDLNRWLSGSYILPGKSLDQADEED
ncbi:DNA gyrase inhibitor YacG [Bartonella tamiae]|uniref:DNA gyrase inhibitor YacG n=1 Tax=Bartonella tamiae Th239 TaxID=1094558 RepID=J0QZN9_9HYPH|nr:DNA gyrase inhibitor YacG [Bartonella tamiae]EJF91631.1 hypothetical protein ME5_00010 [Bartonella tamiae Th239]EJF92694.1 hypothetical protein MEG_01864 [Bartonella tamiae Th307]